MFKNPLVGLAEEIEDKYSERLRRANENLKLGFNEYTDLITGRKQAYEDIIADMKRFKKEVENWLSQNATESEL